MEESSRKDQKASSCPYAKALSEPSASITSMPELIQLKECPAFSSNECPFKGAKSAEEVAERLQQIPPSHLEKNGAFFKTLEFFHQSTTGRTGSSCPVKHSLPKDWSFDQAMEEFSLVAIMARLAKEWDEKDEENDNDLAASSSSEEESAVEDPIPSRHTNLGRSSLSEALKSGTAMAHEAAESVHFVKNFVRGKIDRQLYGLLIAQLYHVYQELEQALDEHAPSYFGSCHFPKELHRKEALKEDLDFWHTSIPAVSPATQDYIDRIRDLSHSNPLLLLAHAYTRYLGDLSGGKVLARVARRALQLQDDVLAFYQFPHVESFKLFKDHYRTCLNQLPLAETQIQELVQEANVAFLLNMRLFEELDVLGGVQGSTIRSLDSVYAKSHARIDLKKQSAATESSECPFLKKSKPKQQARCPWPFILLHDPKTGFQAWQTWLVIGLLFVYFYQCYLV